jgi:hypothetical protein
LNDLIIQCFQQRLGLFEILRVKSFGEPTINLDQHLSRFSGLALTLPQPREAHRYTQFERLGLLFLGNGDGFQKTGFRFALGISSLELGTVAT